MSDHVTLESSSIVHDLQTFEDRLLAPVTAKQAILTALTATGTPLSTGQIRLCGALLGLEPAAVRVALGRLVEKDIVRAHGDGTYEIGGRGRGLAEAIASWRFLPSLTKPWRGRWCAIHTAHLGRTQRGQLRRRERALTLFGFAALHPGLWVRPDNLSIDAEAMRDRLIELGVEDGAVLLLDAAPSNVEAWSELWDREALEREYRAASRAMRETLEGFEALDVQARARQTARIGRAVVELLTFDPLLPDAMVDAGLRKQVQQDMVGFDREGKRALQAWWRTNA